MSTTSKKKWTRAKEDRKCETSCSWSGLWVTWLGKKSALENKTWCIKTFFFLREGQFSKTKTTKYNEGGSELWGSRKNLSSKTGKRFIFKAGTAFVISQMFTVLRTSDLTMVNWWHQIKIELIYNKNEIHFLDSTIVTLSCPVFDETNSFYDANRLIHIVHVICVNQQMYYYIHSLILWQETTSFSSFKREIS